MLERHIYLFQEIHSNGEVVYRAIYKNGDHYVEAALGINREFFIERLGQRNLRRWNLVDCYPEDFLGNRVRLSRIEDTVLRERLHLDNFSEECTTSSGLESRADAKY